MKNVLLKPLFIAISLSYVVFYVFKHLQLPIHPIVRAYWADFCCLFVINGFVLAIIKSIKKDKAYELSIPQLLFSLIACSFLFEYYLPRENVNYTADWLDVLFYFLGLLLFYFWRKKVAKT